MNYRWYNYKSGLLDRKQVTRYFNKDIHSNWGGNTIERRFRKKTLSDVEFIPLSHVRFESEDEEVCFLIFFKTCLLAHKGGDICAIIKQHVYRRF